MGNVSKTFNAICSEQGVQCTVTSDPTDFKTLWHLKSFADKLIMIEYGGETFYLEPNDEVTLKLGALSSEIPRLAALNNGFDQSVLRDKFYKAAL